MGYYQGIGGRLVWQSGEVPGVRQAAARPSSPPTNTIECRWTPSLTVHHRPDLAARRLPAEAGGRHRRAAVRPAVRRDDTSQCRHRHPAQRDHLAGLQPLGRLQPLLRQHGRGAVLHPRPRRRHLRRPGPHRLLRPALRPRLGRRRRRLRRQRAPGHLPGRAARARRHLLDRCRPARPAAAARQPPGPGQPGPRRVLVVADAGRCSPVAGRWRQPGLPRAPTPATARSASSRRRSDRTATRSATSRPPRTR